jgi:hypothetical protein
MLQTARILVLDVRDLSVLRSTCSALACNYMAGEVWDHGDRRNGLFGRCSQQTLLFTNEPKKNRNQTDDTGKHEVSLTKIGTEG